MNGCKSFFNLYYLWSFITGTWVPKFINSKLIIITQKLMISQSSKNLCHDFYEKKIINIKVYVYINKYVSTCVQTVRSFSNLLIVYIKYVIVLYIGWLINSFVNDLSLNKDFELTCTIMGWAIIKSVSIVNITTH